MRRTPLELYEQPAGASSFDEILDSAWLLDSPGTTDRSSQRHFVVQTCDEVFEVLCSGFNLTLDTA